jgi:hypothetical protein
MGERKRRWPAWLVAIVVLVVVIVGGAMFAAAFVDDYGESYDRFIRGVATLAPASALIAYFIQRNRLS